MNEQHKHSKIRRIVACILVILSLASSIVSSHRVNHAGDSIRRLSQASGELGKWEALNPNTGDSDGTSQRIQRMDSHKEAWLGLSLRIGGIGIWCFIAALFAGLAIGVLLWDLKVSM